MTFICRLGLGHSWIPMVWEVQTKHHQSVRGFEATCYKLSLAFTLSGAQTGLLYYSNTLHLSHVIFSTWKQLHSIYKQKGWMCSLNSQDMSEFASFKLLDNFLYPRVAWIVLQWVTREKTSYPGLPKLWRVLFGWIHCDGFSVPPLSPLHGNVWDPFSHARTRGCQHRPQAFEGIYWVSQPDTTQGKC